MGMNVGSGGRTGARADINITPLIDVVLVLLIIFMVLVPSSLKQLAAVVPRQAPPQAALPPAPPTVVKIGAQGELTVNDESVAASALAQELRKRLSHDETRAVFFDCHADARYDAVVKVMDLAKGAGARTLAIVSRGD